MRTRNFLLGLAIVGSTVAVAACGSSAKSATASTNLGVAFAQCMRAHGVANFPDPGAKGGIVIGPNSGLNLQAPAVQRCGVTPPGGVPR